MIKQVTVFMENVEGRLALVCRTLAQAGINMHALTIADTQDFGVVRIIVDDPNRALDALTQENFRAQLVDVAAFSIPNRPGGLADLLDALAEAKLNIEYGYCFQTKGESAVDVLKIKGENVARALETLALAGYTTLELSDIVA